MAAGINFGNELLFAGSTYAAFRAVIDGSFYHHDFTPDFERSGPFPGVKQKNLPGREGGVRMPKTKN